MKILFVGDQSSYCRSYQRCRALKELGHEVRSVPTHPVGHRPGVSPKRSFLYRVLSRLGLPPDTENTNARVKELAEEEDFDVVWVEKARMLKPGTLRKVKDLQPDTRLAFNSEDDMYRWRNGSIYFRCALPLYDVVFTTKSYNCNPDELPALGARRVVFVDKAFDKHAHRPVSLSEDEARRFGADVCFVGTFEEHRARLITYLAENDVPVRVWGNGWEDWNERPKCLQIEERPVYGDDYAKVLNASKICLCFLRKANRDLQTARTMEIPACGSFMLAERTEEHLRLFEEGEEVEYFDPDSPEELLRKARYYLENEDEREKIAKKGRERCVESGYSHHDRIKYMLGELKPKDS